MGGRVHQINISKGGVPKLPIEHAVVDERGIVGDEQADRVHHGHPDQALCLFSLEVIERFRTEGHPIFAGSSGENITVTGLDWADVTPGKRMTIGAVQVEITHYATPCSKNARWFVDGKYNRMHASRHPGESRLYARVIEGGPIASGDPVELLG
ncbi:MAG TPA: MOSC domain-containing protein [Acidimicrobiia bacterium]|jgi:MOSC domain-containing protein YiiM|nr:MOSC domain-containing protein [Acidimicrobiia bacterium]